MRNESSSKMTLTVPTPDKKQQGSDDGSEDTSSDDDSDDSDDSDDDIDESDDSENGIPEIQEVQVRKTAQLSESHVSLVYSQLSESIDE